MSRVRDQRKCDHPHRTQLFITERWTLETRIWSVSCSHSETVLKIDEDEIIQSHSLVYVRLSPDAKILILSLFILFAGSRGPPRLCVYCPGVLVSIRSGQWDYCDPATTITPDTWHILFQYWKGYSICVKDNPVVGSLLTTNHKQIFIYSSAEELEKLFFPYYSENFGKEKDSLL